MAEYESLRQKHVARFGEILPDLVQRLWWGRERLEQQRTDALRRMVELARERSPWHGRRLAGIDVDALTPAELSLLPVMTKDDLMAHWDEIVTDRRLTLELADRHVQTISSDAYLLDEYHVVASGGSSGRRGVFVWGWDAWATAYAVGVRWGIRRAMSDPSAGDRPPVVAIVAANAPTHMTSAMSATFSAPPVIVHPFPVTRPLGEIVAGLNTVQPTILTGYASALHELAHAALRGDLRIAPAAVTSTSEPLLPEIRHLLERAWAGAAVGNIWGTSEASSTAVSCYFAEGMHPSDDVVIVEPVDDDGRPVRLGETSARIYLTNLYNPTLPLLRYEITDQVQVLAEPCPCGSVFSRIADIQGRIDDVFRYPGRVTIHPLVFASPLRREPGVLEYQVRQSPDGADIAVRTSREVDLDALRAQIAEHVAAAGLREPRIELAKVTSIERTAAGKLRRFVPM